MYNSEIAHCMIENNYKKINKPVVHEDCYGVYRGKYFPVKDKACG
jgi:penicillin-binding protein-related factor A (putative recombinase)